MKVNVLTNNLQKKLSFLNHAVSQKSQLPILLNIFFETINGKLKISTTDLEIGIETILSATTEEQGSATSRPEKFMKNISLNK